MYVAISLCTHIKNENTGLEAAFIFLKQI